MVQPGFGKLQTYAAQWLSSGSHCAIHSTTRNPHTLQGREVNNKTFHYGHGFTFEGFQERSQCPLFTCIRSCPAVTHLPATENAPRLVLVIPVSVTTQGRASCQFPTTVCNTLAFSSEPFCLLQLHTCAITHNTKLELPLYHLMELCFL